MKQDKMIPQDVKEKLSRRFWEHIMTYAIAYIKIGLSAMVAGILSLAGDLQKMDEFTVSHMTWRDWSLLVLVTAGAVGNNILASLSQTFAKARTIAEDKKRLAAGGAETTSKAAQKQK